MSAVANKVLEEALNLPMEDRAVLVDSVIHSLNATDPEIDQLWAQEAESRINAAERGEMKIISEEDVFAKHQKK
jgi:putative addiction module component (TIGR02574 family)